MINNDGDVLIGPLTDPRNVTEKPGPHDSLEASQSPLRIQNTQHGDKGNSFIQFSSLQALAGQLSPEEANYSEVHRYIDN
jgi:hypothetical protein